jgi:hypothetical protein
MATPANPDQHHGSPPGREPTSDLVQVYAKRPEGYDGTCLRPLGLCELGGCCDVCWYRPNHPRFAKSGKSED